MPAIGGITYLNTLKNNVRYAQLEFLKAMLSPEIPADAADRDMRYVLINEGQMIVEADGTVERPLVDIRPHIESALYEDYDNRIEILAIGIAPSGIDFSVSGASCRFSDGSLYIHPQKGVHSSSGSFRSRCRTYASRTVRHTRAMYLSGSQGFFPWNTSGPGSALSRTSDMK